uniref:RNA polymerase sigma factor rpoD n=1 Tax=Rhizophora mucronata TaxID=61149 RepID=A0A2P2L9Y5_RHIMU
MSIPSWEGYWKQRDHVPKRETVIQLKKIWQDVLESQLTSWKSCYT